MSSGKYAAAPTAAEAAGAAARFVKEAVWPHVECREDAESVAARHLHDTRQRRGQLEARGRARAREEVERALAVRVAGVGERRGCARPASIASSAAMRNSCASCCSKPLKAWS